MARKTDNLLDDSINVPVPHKLKQRVVRVAKKSPGKPSHTRWSREALLEKVEQAERSLGIENVSSVAASK